MGSCANCHKAKVRCDNEHGFPCKRCVRLKARCVPHVSRQGKGRSNLQTRRQDLRATSASSTFSVSTKAASASSRSDVSQQVCRPSTTKPAPTADAGTQTDSSGLDATMFDLVQFSAIPQSDIKPEASPNGIRNVDQLQQNVEYDHKDPTSEYTPVETHSVRAVPKHIPQDHFGMHCMIRFWLASAIRRRSFPMLAKAAQLASKVGIEMDDLMSLKLLGPMYDSPAVNNQDESTGSGKARREALSTMTMIGRLMALPVEQQKTCESWLYLQDIPIRHRQALNMVDEAAVGDRWLLVRHGYKGIVSFYVSPQFLRNVVPWDRLDGRNFELEIRDLFLEDDVARRKVGCALVQMIQMWRYPNTKPRFIRIPNVPVKMVRSGTTRNVDMYFWICLDGVDDAWGHVEFVPVGSRREGDGVRIHSCDTLDQQERGSGCPPSGKSRDSDEAVATMGLNQLRISLATNGASTDDAIMAVSAECKTPPATGATHSTETDSTPIAGGDSVVRMKHDDGCTLPDLPIDPASMLRVDPEVEERLSVLESM